MFLAEYDDARADVRETGREEAVDGVADADGGGQDERRRRVLAMIAYVMWWIGVAWMTGTLVFVMGVLTGALGGPSERWMLRKGAGAGGEEEEEVRITMPRCLLSSAFGMGLVAAVGGLLVSVLVKLGTISVGMAATVLVLAFCVVGVAVFTTLFLYAVLQQEMIHVESQESIPLVMLSLWMAGTVSVCGAAVLMLGSAAEDVSAILGDTNGHGGQEGNLFTPATAQIAHIVCTILALLLLGLVALLFIFTLVGFVSLSIRGRLSWKVQWSDGVIPVAALALLMVQFRAESDSAFFGIVTCLLVVAAAAALLINLVLCIKQVVSGTFLTALDDELRV